MSSDPFPDKPSYAEVQEKKPNLKEMLLNEDYKRSDSWYNQAPFVAARIIIHVANEYDGFKQEFLTSEQSVGAAHAMSEYDEEQHRKLNDIGLSAFQGAHAEKMARKHLEGQE